MTSTFAEFSWSHVSCNSKQSYLVKQSSETGMLHQLLQIHRYQQSHYPSTHDPAQGSHTSPSQPAQRRTPLKAILGLSTPIAKLKPPVLWLSSRLWHHTSICAELTGAECPSFLSGCALGNKYQTKGTLRKKQLSPCLLLTCLPPVPNLHCLLHLTAGQAIHALSTTVARMFLCIPSPFLPPGDFTTGPRTIFRQGLAHYCRNLLSKDSRGPTQHIPAGSTSCASHCCWVWHTGRHCTLLLGRASWGFLLVSDHTKHMLTAEKHRKPLKIGRKTCFQAGKHFWKTVKAPPVLHQNERKAFQSCVCLFSGTGYAAFHSPGWCKDPQQPGGESPGLTGPLLPSLTASTITCTKPVSSCSFTKDFTWNTSSNKTTAAAGKFFSLTDQHPKVVPSDKPWAAPGRGCAWRSQEVISPQHWGKPRDECRQLRPVPPYKAGPIPGALCTLGHTAQKTALVRQRRVWFGWRQLSLGSSVF